MAVVMVAAAASQSKRIGKGPRIEAWRGLLEHDWQLMTDTCAHLAFGWSESEVGRIAAENLRDSVSRGHSTQH